MKVHRSILTLSAGHFFIDAYSSMLGAFLPFLHDKLNLSLTQAGILGGALVFSSSLMQPLYGYLADRFPHKIFAAASPAIAGIFISALGGAPNFVTLLLLVILGGIGIAAFHPQGAAVTGQIANQRPGYQMSVFITGGMMGYALGPLYITSVIALAGLENSYWAAVPGVLMSVYLLSNGPSPEKSHQQVQGGVRLRERLKQRRQPLLVLYFLVVLRSINQLAFVAFLPLYFTTRGYTDVEGGQLLTLFLLAGGMAGFLGGVLADRLGGKTVIVISTAAYCPLLLAFLLTSGPLSIILCALGGAFLLLTTPVNVLMAQKLVPQQASTVSALMMGFAWGVGGLFVPITGILSDLVGLGTTLMGLVLLTSPALFLAFALPSRAEMHAATSGRTYRSIGTLAPSDQP